MKNEMIGIVMVLIVLIVLLDVLIFMQITNILLDIFMFQC